MSGNNKIVAIAESSYISRKGLLHIFNKFPFIGRVIELDENADLKEQVTHYQPDILVINPILTGILSAENLRQHFSSKRNTCFTAFVTCSIDKQYLQHFDIVIESTDNETTIAQKFESVKWTEKTQETEELSKREKEILVAIVKGMSNKEIADHLNISIHTAITHRRNITRKLDIHSSSGLTVYAILNKLVDINEIKL